MNYLNQLSKFEAIKEKINLVKRITEVKNTLNITSQAHEIIDLQVEIVGLCAEVDIMLLELEEDLCSR